MKKNYILVVMLFMTLSYGGLIQSDWIINIINIDTKSLADPEGLPSDVTILLEKINECSHWVAEWQPGIEVERKFMVEEKINSVCLDAIHKRHKLLKKYKDDPHVLEHLN